MGKKQYATLRVGKTCFEIVDSTGFVLDKGIIDKIICIYNITQALNQVAAMGWDVVTLMHKNDTFTY